MAATLKPSALSQEPHPLQAQLDAAGASGPGEVVARETRDGVAWLVVEFPGYGTVSAPADEFNEV